MWGKLLFPSTWAHTIFKDNAAGSVALAKVKWMSASSSIQYSTVVAQLLAAHFPPTCPKLLMALAPASQPPTTT